MKRRRVMGLIGAAGLIAVIAIAPKMVSAQQQRLHVVVVRDVIHVMSPRLGGMKPVPPAKGVRRQIPLRHPLSIHSNIQPTTLDPVLQTTLATAGATNPWINFLGVGNNQPNFGPCCAPPDPNGAAGPTQYVQWVNTAFAVFSKSTGQIQYGPAEGNTLWQPLGGSCAANNSGDIIAQYDKQAQRWVMMQPVFSSPYQLCVAVSTTSDAIGTYNLYDFTIPNNYFPDYPKLAVWPDAYYMSYNAFTSATGAYISGYACALDRAAMLQGSPSTMQCFETGYPSLLPSDLDGDSGAPGTTSAPPAGSPDYYMDFTTTSALNLFAFHVDWTNPANSTWTANPTVLPVASFSEACGGGTCIPQPGTSQQLDSLGDRLMYRLAYRNFGSYQSMVVSQSVNTGSGSTGIRWYEIRNPGSSPTVYQQGTFAPDSNYRWMPSIAEDKLGDIAMGYSVSSSTIYPSIRVAGRVPGDPLGTMEAESSLLAGAASQTSGLARWGDYTSMSVDPTNDCTFWYTNEYQPSNGTFNWGTQVGSFSFPGCAAPPPANFSLTGAPLTGSVDAGSSVNYLLSVDPVGGYTGNVTLSLVSPSSLPAGMTVSFSSGTVDVSGASFVGTTMKVSTTAATPGGTYQLQVSGTDGTNTDSVTVPIVVHVPDFSLSVSPTTNTITGTSAQYTVNVVPSNGYTGSVTLSMASALPNNVTASFSTNPVTISNTSPGSSLLEISLSATAPAGTYNLTVSGTDGTLTHTTQLTLTIPNADFSLSVSPTTNTMTGTYADYTVNVVPSSGYTGSVTLSMASSLPSGVAATFYTNPVPLSITGSGSSLLEFTFTAPAPAGTYNLTVSGTDGTLTHTTQLTLTIPKSDFSLTGLVSQSLAAGNGTTLSFYVTTADDYSGSVSLSLTSPSTLPTGMTVSFQPNPINVQTGMENYVAINVNTTVATPQGAYNLTVSASDGTNTHTISCTLTVLAPPPPDFSINTSIASAGVVAGTSLVDTIRIMPSYGFTGNVSLSITSPSSLPAGMTATFSPQTVNVTGTTAVDSTLTIATATTTPPGSYNLTITGTAGTLTHTTFLDINMVAPSDFSLAGSPTTQTVTQGNSASYTISVVPSGNFTSAVSLSTSSLPTGTTATFSPASVSTSSGTAISALTIFTSSSTPIGTFSFNVIGTGGGTTHSIPLSFTVQPTTSSDFTISATPSTAAAAPGSSTSYSVTVDGTGSVPYNGTVNLSVSGVPRRTSTSWSTTSITGSGTAILSVLPNRKATDGTYTLTITGTSGSLTHSATVTFVIGTLSTPDFSLSASPTTQTVNPGVGTSYAVAVSSINGFTGTVDLSAGNLPSGVTASWSSTSISGSGTATLAVATLSTATPGTYTLTVSGVSGTLSHTTQVTLVIQNPSSGGDFSISISPSSQSVGPKSSTSYTITVGALNGFTGTVNLSVSGLPNRTSSSFSSTTITGSGTSTLTISTNPKSPAGGYSLTVTGTSGSITHTASATLNIT